MRRMWLREAGDELAPLFASVFAGTPVQMEDITLELDRGDHRDEAHFSFSYTPVLEDAGEVMGLFGVCIDTSERVPAAKHANLVRASRNLRESELRYRTLFNAIDEGFCVIEFFDGPHGPDSDYIRIAANPAYAVHTGIPNVVGQKVREMSAPKPKGGSTFTPGAEDRQTHPLQRKLEATDRWLNLAAFRVEPASRRQVAALVVDVTARKKSGGGVVAPDRDTGGARRGANDTAYGRGRGTAPITEDGSGRPTDRGPRTRFQQSPLDRHGKPRAARETIGGGKARRR